MNLSFRYALVEVFGIDPLRTVSNAAYRLKCSPGQKPAARDGEQQDDRDQYTEDRHGLAEDLVDGRFRECHVNIKCRTESPAMRRGWAFPR